MSAKGRFCHRFLVFKRSPTDKKKKKAAMEEEEEERRE